MPSRAGWATAIAVSRMSSWAITRCAIKTTKETGNTVNDIEIAQAMKCLDSLCNPDPNTVYLKDVKELLLTFRGEWWNSTEADDEGNA